MPQSHVLSLENEDTEFIEEFMRVRNNDDVPLAEDDVEATPDPYLHMEFTLPRGVDGAPVNYEVKKRVVDDDGKP